MDCLRIGTRGSALALRQARWVKEQLERRHSGLRCELVAITTTGDRLQHLALGEMEGRGVFVKEIERALLEGRVDLAVHSLKDLPVELPEGLVLAAVPPRGDPLDALVSRDGAPLEGLPPGARVGTSSARRRLQLLLARPDLEVVSLRGNLDTRLRKLEAGQVEAIVVAAVGLQRLGLERRPAQRLSPEVMLPSPGQGALAVESRADDHRARALAAALEDRASRQEVTAERAFLRRLGGGCRVPIAALGRVRDGVLWLWAGVGTREGTMIRQQGRALPEEAEALGVELAERILRSSALASGLEGVIR